MGIRGRLDRLERTTRGPCPGCGHGGPLVLLPIVFDADGVQVIEPDARPDPCPECGRRPLRLNPITFDGIGFPVRFASDSPPPRDAAGVSTDPPGRLSRAAARRGR